MTSSMPDQTRFDHVRALDGEHVGYLTLTPEGGFIPFDLLGRRRGEPAELDVAEAVLDGEGLSVLTTTFVLDGADAPGTCVRITELTRDTVTLAPVMDDLDPGREIDLTARWTIPLPTERLAERGQPR